MKKIRLELELEVYPADSTLHLADAELLQRARAVALSAYAPYSNYFVGAAARLGNGLIVTGTNQENASYPAGICAERVLLSAAASLHPEEPILAIAVSSCQPGKISRRPVAPCGICRQSINELEDRYGQPIRLILGGTAGEIYIIRSVKGLLPLAFGGKELGKGPK
jgi:cytidine deaminase